MTTRNLIRTIHGLLVLVAIFSTIPAQAEDDRAEETAHLEGEAREVADWVIACQRAGWEDFDVEMYLSQWAEDATVVLGRTSEPGQYDMTYDHETIVATRTFRMRGQDPEIRLAYHDVSVVLDGDKAVMDTRTITSSRDSDYREITRERFTLRRTEDGWLVVEDRAWLVGELVEGERHVVDGSTWRELDGWIADEFVTERDTRWLRYFLLKAFRFQEAHVMAVEVCEQDDATAEDWSRRGVFAVLVGDIEDAELALETAIELDPDVWLPYYAMPDDAAE